MYLRQYGFRVVDFLPSLENSRGAYILGDIHKSHVNLSYHFPLFHTRIQRSANTVMELAWNVPEVNQAKINMHHILRDAQAESRNINRVGVIVRDSHGLMIWEALGPLNDMTEQEALT